MKTTSTRFSTTLTSRYTRDPDQRAWKQTNFEFQEGAANTTIIPNNGSFSFFPAYPVGGLILNTVTDVLANQPHAKHDNSRYSYLNRSYGIASSVGLVGEVQTLDHLQTYSFTESGYDAQVSCMTNHSSVWQVIPEEQEHLPGMPDNYVAIGWLPNSAYLGGNPVFGVAYSDLYNDGIVFEWLPEGYPVLGFQTNTEIVALAGLSNNGRNIIALTTYGQGIGKAVVESKYGFLDKVQCEVAFTARQFHVVVDTKQKFITVTKGNSLSTDEEVQFDPTTAISGSGLGLIVQRAMRQVMTLAMINTSVYTSVLGDGKHLSSREAFPPVHCAAPNLSI